MAQELRVKAMEEKVIPVVPIVDSKTSELPMGAMASLIEAIDVFCCWRISSRANKESIYLNILNI